MPGSSVSGSSGGPQTSLNQVLCAEYDSSSDYTNDSKDVEVDSGSDIATAEEEPIAPGSMARAHCRTVLEYLEKELLLVGSWNSIADNLRKRTLLEQTFDAINNCKIHGGWAKLTDSTRIAAWMAEITRCRSSPNAQVDMTIFARHPFVDPASGVTEQDGNAPPPPSSSPATPLKSVLKRRASDSSFDPRNLITLKRTKTLTTPPSLGQNHRSKDKHRPLLWGPYSTESRRIRYGRPFRGGDITPERRVRFWLDQKGADEGVTTPTKSRRTKATVKAEQKHNEPTLRFDAPDELVDLRTKYEGLSQVSSKKDETIRALQEDLAKMKDRVDSLEAKAIESKRDQYRSGINTTKLEERISDLEKRSKTQSETRAVVENAKQELKRHSASVDAKLTTFMDELHGQFRAFDEQLSSRYPRDQGQLEDVVHRGVDARECSVAALSQDMNSSVA